MRAFMSSVPAHWQAIGAIVEANAKHEDRVAAYRAAAMDEARRILAETEPSSPEAGIYSQTVPLSALRAGYEALRGKVGRPYTIRTDEAAALAEALARFVALPECVICGAPFDHGCNTAACSEECQDAAYYEERNLAESIDHERIAYVRPTERQSTIPGTTRPESRPTIRTEGRESDGPLFTQERDASDRATVRSQRRIF